MKTLTDSEGNTLFDGDDVFDLRAQMDAQFHQDETGYWLKWNDGLETILLDPKALTKNLSPNPRLSNDYHRIREKQPLHQDCFYWQV